MVVSTIWAALRRRPFSVLVTLCLLALYSRVLYVPVPLALAVWVLASLVAVEVALLFERVVLEWLGCRAPTVTERVQLQSSLQRCRVTIRIVDDSTPWIGGALRTVIVSRGVLELLDERTLLGVLGQVSTMQRSGWLVRHGVVWLGHAPLLAAWFAGRVLAEVGRGLAIALGYTLVVPMLLWPTGFVRWAGRVFGAAIVGMVGALLLSGGVAAAGLGLLLAWVLVPAVRALLAWETRRAEADADCAMVREGLGAELLEGLDLLALTEPTRPAGVLGLLVVPGAQPMTRIERLRRALGVP